MSKFRLSNALEQLRQDLETVAAGDGKKVLFDVKDITLEIELVVDAEAGGKAGVQWFVFSGGADARTSSATTHRLTLKLGVVGPDGAKLRPIVGTE